MLGGWGNALGSCSLLHDNLITIVASITFKISLSYAVMYKRPSYVCAAADHLKIRLLHVTCMTCLSMKIRPYLVLVHFSNGSNKYIYVHCMYVHCIFSLQIVSEFDVLLILIVQTSQKQCFSFRYLASSTTSFFAQASHLTQLTHPHTLITHHSSHTCGSSSQ
jgi:hypothetical protein